MNRVRDALDHTNLTDASSLMSQFKRQTNDAILANRDNLHTVSEFAVECIAVDILGHDRFRDLVTARNGRHQEIHHLSSLPFVGVEKIDSFVSWFDSKSRFMSLVLQNKLLQVVKRLFVIRLLPHLNL